ncbi:EAL domain-containing protein [Paenibacillaceae bacterium WGS1546]|uniref:EAL domain-containing protein n=1 Tax=Cohnella sp. WGS1546 TaxID=3366810 RepID=UPI00372D1CF9
MTTAWFGLEKLVERSERHRAIGLIGIALPDRREAFVPALRDREADWPRWLADALDGDALSFAEEVGGNLWLYADLPEGLEDGEAYLRGIAGKVKAAMTAADGARTNGWAEYPQRERGIGCALLNGLRTDGVKEALFEGIMAVSAQIKHSLAGDRDWEYRLELERLLAERSIRSVYQPIVRLGDGRVFGYEALTRCPESSLFDGPSSLFRYAERLDKALPLDRLAREKAIRHCPPLGPGRKIFINVTMSIVNDPHFVSGQTLRWLDEKGLRPGQVVLELTERSSIDDFEAAKKMLAHYRSQGYEIAIDDAGAGYSSLQSIVELSPDYIKVDRSLVSLADREEMKKQMLRTFVRFAKKMNIRTVAEGIERPEELRLLRALGYDYAQGYLIGRPDDASALAAAGAVPEV